MSKIGDLGNTTLDKKIEEGMDDIYMFVKKLLQMTRPLEWMISQINSMERVVR